MNTNKISKNMRIALPLLILVVMGLVGCDALEVSTVEAKVVDANPIVVEAVEIMNNEIQMEPDNGSANAIPIDQLPSVAEASPLLRDDDAIRAVLAAHFEVDESTFYHFGIKENTGSHARGGVDNGYFLAAKVDGQWLFVDGGHAAPNCNEVAKYGFPASMVPECEFSSVPPTDSDEEDIRAALAAHFEVDESTFYHFGVKENTGSHARGGVDNGYFLAAKVDGQWLFVDGGHAAPNCNEVAKYGFPASMVPGCPTGGSNSPDCPGLGTTVATFITDVTFPDGSIVSPGSSFIKTWRIKNVGTCTWNSEYALVFESGDAMSGPAYQQLTDIHIPPGESIDISVQLTAPDTPGTYRGDWKFRGPYGDIFGLSTGNPIWVEVKVLQ
ncbi:MAG: NBR1-Ig-like domain-containing protein [Anaerolineales bacterium]